MRSLRLPAVLTPLGCVGDAFLAEELLFTGAEGKCTSAVHAGDRLILIGAYHLWPFLLFNESVSFFTAPAMM